MIEVLLFSFLAIIVGLGLSFMGYAAFRILLPILGFLAGFWLGLDIVANFAQNFPLMGVSLGLVLGFVLGVVFAAVAYFVYALAVMIFGSSYGICTRRRTYALDWIPTRINDFHSRNRSSSRNGCIIL